MSIPFAIAVNGFINEKIVFMQAMKGMSLVNVKFGGQCSMVVNSIRYYDCKCTTVVSAPQL